MENKISGIYCIEDTRNYKKYIGQSKDINTRFGGHKSKLKRNCHENQHLQNIYNKYGMDVFNFYVIKECPIDCLDEQETYYIDFYKTINPEFGYNIEKGGNKPPSQLGVKQTEETKTKRAEKLKGRKKTDEEKKKISESKKGKPNNRKGATQTEESKKKMSDSKKGKKMSDEARKNMSIAQKGKVISEETKKKMSEAQLGEKHHMYGKKASEETRKKQSESRKGKNRGNCSIINEDIAREIKKLLAEGLRVCDIARIMNVARHMVTNIKRGQCWGYV